MRYPEILSIRPEPRRFVYDEQYTMLYALALNAGSQSDDLAFVYEKRLRALPTLAVIMPNAVRKIIDDGEINHTMIVHGEQHLTIHKPLPAKGTVILQARCLSVIDKGADKGALVNVENIISDSVSAERHATSVTTMFCRGDGGFNGPAEGELARHIVPARPHDLEVVLPTLPQQATLYRLTGDRNPLHIDPKAAQAAGFSRPILHGLCTYGMAGRAILQACCDNDPSMIETLDARFSSPVYPGETVVTRIWRDDNALSFECHVAERSAPVIRNGLCRLRA
jgi:acyl dehydratase